MRKIGINFQSVQGLGDEEIAKTIKDLGFSATFTGLKEKEYQLELAELFAKHGIEYETIHAPFRQINDIWLDGEDGAAVVNELIKSVDHCVMAGVPILVVHLSSGQTPPSITDIGRARFARIVEHAAKNNIRIAFENQRKLANISWAFETFGEDSLVGFCWDCGHESCFTPGRQYMPLFADRLICTHIHDNTGIFNHDLHMLPFDGAVDFERVAKQLRECSYAGSLMLEVMAHKSSLYDNVSPYDYLKKAADAAKRFAKMVDGE